MTVVIKKQQGFTLIEIMVALIIGIFLTVGVSQIFLNTKRTNRMQENLSRMQENARFAMNYITEDIRKADYWGGDCVEGMITSTASNLKNGDSADKYKFDASTAKDAVWGTEGDVSLISSVLNDPDMIRLKAFFNIGAGIPVISNSVDDKLEVKDGSNFEQNDIVLVTNCTDKSDIFQITNNDIQADNTKDVLQGETGAGEDNDKKLPGNKSSPEGYNNKAKVFNLSGDRLIIYSIDSANGALQRGVNGANSDEDLVDDIENMQILYGVKNVTGDGVYYAPFSAAMVMDNVISVRVSLLVRSPDNNITSAPKAYFYNGSTVTPGATDKYLRKVYTSTVMIRNRLP
ncbi:MAG: prepilin-type N-terminal cleavage/methylation domain-containing protein [Methylococcaceae bacterium]|nr:prepilin-type N-terminal cleavage/methylation domain-containing protein [Methylococcaceae bacterium]